MVAKVYEGVGEEFFTFDALHLLSHTDLEGHTTYYVYDDMGRKIREERCGRTIEYTYDSLSRVSTVTKGGITTHYKHDFLDRVIEESTPYSITTYTFDEDGNRSSVTTGNSIETFVYDPLKRLIKQTDALGNTTLFHYTDFQKITVDPKGISTIETFDIHENLISKEISGVAAFRYTYDREANLILQEEDVYKNNQYLKTLKTAYSYTPNNKLASFSQFGATTRYTYTPTGKVKTKTKPDGSVIEYAYDRLGYLIAVGGDTFVYNKLGQLISGRGFVREVDPFGNVIKETLSNGLTIEKTYDNFDRPLTVKLPNDSTITYAYDVYLKSISYKGYTHLFTYNLAGHMLTNGLTTYTKDLKGQITQLDTPHIQQECIYDALGNLTYATPNSYTYDALSQLGSEFDSHFDLPDAQETGNLTSHNGCPLYYDLHDRLIKAGSTVFTYDALRRRLSKNDELYLYDGLTEIGTFKEGKAYIKISNVLLELNGKLTIPIFDATHSLRYLIDPSTQVILNSYAFDPFGNPIHISESLYNPYRYALKHYDEETGFIYFGKRYYNPSIRRWITPDPAGPIDLINLYAFVRNNPFRYTDYIGLYASDRLLGAWQAWGGAMETQIGIGLCTFPLFIPLGSALILHGTDNFITGCHTALTGQNHDTLTSRLLQKAALPSLSAHFIDNAFGMVSSKGASILMQKGVKITNTLLPMGSSLLGGSFGKSEEVVQYTKSNLRLGKQIHKSYKMGEVILNKKTKEFVLPSGRRIDFLDRVNGKVYELKPNNPRAIREGQKQLQRYIEELKTIPRFKDIQWEGILETY